MATKDADGASLPSAAKNGTQATLRRRHGEVGDRQRSQVLRNIIKKHNGGLAEGRVKKKGSPANLTGTIGKSTAISQEGGQSPSA